MTSGAFNAHTASLEILNNDFRKIRRKAFEIRNWNSIFIHGNLFQSVEPDFFSAPFTKTAGVRTEFVFTNNTFPSIEVGALSFIPRETELYVTIENNTIESVCHCYLKAWIRERTGDSWESFYKTSFCLISDLLRYCYNISKDRMNMHDYAEHFCTSKNVQNCEDVQKIDSEDNLTPLNLNNMGQTFLSVIFLSVISSVALVIAIITLIWARRKGFCGYKRKSSGSDLPLCCSNFCNQSNLVSTDSISRVNIHEYAEIQNQLNTLQKQANPATEDNAEGEEFVECENRATQTLPEELTQELIQSLREKLEDPENYNEARTMIEHLYDLIKVEESCNKDNVSLTTSFGFGDEDEDIEGLYEVVDKPKPLSVKNVKRKTAEIDVTSRGTRVPSPDKLSPIDFNVARRLPVVVSDYVEPRDRKSNEYCELPAAVNPIMPDVLTSSQIKENSDSAKCHIYAEPLTSSKRKQLPNKDNQPQTSHS